MAKFYITRTGNLFSWIKIQEDREYPDNEWITLDIKYLDNQPYSSQSDGLISAEVVSSEPSRSEFHFATILNGTYTHQFGYGKNFKLGWEVTIKKIILWSALYLEVP